MKKMILLFILILCACSKESRVQKHDPEKVALEYTTRFLRFFCVDRKYMEKYPCNFENIKIEKQSKEILSDRTVFHYLIYDKNRLLMDFHVYVKDKDAHAIKSNYFTDVAGKYEEQGKL
ncbi:hypothetical protein GF327_08905 [Candidatus Woesearchaeota archaeon]|nr:hypothetical protein [Candidatus Woesearchaeota archaeon]